MAKTRILYIITNLALGGAQKNALYTIAHLDSNKYEKHFISASQGGLCEQVNQHKDINLHFLDCLKRNISLIKDIQAFFAIRQYIKQHKIEIVHTHSSKAGILGRWAAKFAQAEITIHTVHGWSFNDYMPRPIKLLYVLLERITAKITTCFIAVSNNDIKKGLKHKIGTAKQYALIRYGIEINKFYQVPLNNLKNNKQIVGMIACLKPQKNPLDFIKAAAIIAKTNKNVEFVCVGNGKLRKNIEAEIRRNELSARVTLLGWRKDISGLIALMDIVVLTSLWEGLPIVLLEAMAAAKPIVAYDTDGIREAVWHKENGYLVAQKDFKGLAIKIKKLLDDPVLAKNMGQKGYTLLSKSEFNAAHMMRQIETLYANLQQKK